MNRDDVIRWAREVGLHLPYWADDEDPEIDPPRWTMVSPLPLLLERFAAAAYAAGAAAEREACAKVCDELQDVPATEPRHCAKDIRARGQA